MVDYSLELGQSLWDTFIRLFGAIPGATLILGAVIVSSIAVGTIITQANIIPVLDPPPPSGICLVSNREDWGPTYEAGECNFGSTVTRTNAEFLCTQPLANYGTLPLRVVITSTNVWAGNGVLLNPGCTGDGNNDTIDLMFELNGNGTSQGVAGDILKFRTFGNQGPSGIQMTGFGDCGDPGGHFDWLQVQSTNANGSFIAIVNGKSGDWEDGIPTCQAAGGMLFWSDDANVSILGGEYIGCNHGLNGGAGSPPHGAGVIVTDAKFRVGDNPANTSNCNGVAQTVSCEHTTGMTLTNVTCQEWSGSAYINQPPEP